MRRKYQIFISSSFEDFQEERRELIIATLLAGHIPMGMELMKPGYASSLDIIERKIRDSDIFVILVGARLGMQTEDLPDAMAYTEHEYDLAQKLGLPIIAFLLEDTEYKEKRGQHIPYGDKLNAFREKVKKGPQGYRNVGFFSKLTTNSSLVRQYSNAIDECTRDIEEKGPYGGWVKGQEYDKRLDEIDKLRDLIILEEAVSKNPFFKDLGVKLNKFARLSSRTTVRKDLKIGAASYFWQCYFPALYHQGIKAIFFESGSSIAYVSREFINQIRINNFFYSKGMHETIRIRTNNVLTYLDFLFQDNPWEPMDVALYPQGPFSYDYGGTYGKLNDEVPELLPHGKYPPRKKLPNDSQALVNQVKSDLMKEFEKGGLVLMAASGVDTNEESSYPGPHVGSYPNMLLKRSLLELPCPKVLFLDPIKWGFAGDYNHCHAVCDLSFPWSEVISSSPLAVALSTDTKGAQEWLASELAQKGFTDVDKETPKAGSEGPWSIIAANKAFTNFFEFKEVVP